MKKMLWALLVLLSFSISAFAGVNINTATQAELESLNGIGPVKAKAIIDYRKKNGDFKSVDDLEKVDGVGAVTLQNVRKDVSVSGKTTVVAPAAKTVGNEKAAASGKTADTKEVKPMTDKKAAKDSKAVGNEKAATSGKTADTKEVKPTTEKKAAKEEKAAATDTKVKADVKADTKAKSDTKAKVDTKAEAKTKKDTADKTDTKAKTDT